MSITDQESLLEIKNLQVDLPGPRKGTRKTIIQDVSLSIRAGEAVGLVGESGSGKSMTTKAIMRLLPKGAETRGTLNYKGRQILTMSSKELLNYRSHEVSKIYQDSRSHMNPLLTIGDFLVEGVVSSGAMTREAAMTKSAQLMEEVGIMSPQARLAQYPHQLSGGQLQRIMIVMALLPNPGLILADEPTAALDMTVQSEVMAILNEQLHSRNMGMLFITHDLDLAAAVTDTLAVMYAGVIVEQGPTQALYDAPRHPYTAGLLASRPSPTEVKKLVAIPGQPISASESGQGCVFEKRCAFSVERCRLERPALRNIDGQMVACHRAEEIVDRLPAGRAA
ncbi:ABC transporter ATP-binding protein [Paenarthrobacter nitroguajacolicus]|uniref:ABC transporter ATP-binding protein n=1 Tax=Paenarthrobacter nitroguajacolicus TaxID=211146 RepID=UPI00285A0F5A|nr:ABC transporter ATP-binding protein [Paenarthrobacter nitroguajacolicus]MDR6639502.1 oligopeptide/dipeptide ABC transporter ATP-binding protein [Paenarthrobacter nitroguajacolicus]